jgi:hypothetical protein
MILSKGNIPVYVLLYVWPLHITYFTWLLSLCVFWHCIFNLYNFWLVSLFLVFYGTCLNHLVLSHPVDLFPVYFNSYSLLGNLVLPSLFHNQIVVTICPLTLWTHLNSNLHSTNCIFNSSVTAINNSTNEGSLKLLLLEAPCLL